MADEKSHVETLGQITQFNNRRYDRSDTIKRKTQNELNKGNNEGVVEDSCYRELYIERQGNKESAFVLNKFVINQSLV